MASSSNEEILPEDQGDFAPNKDHWHKRKNSPDSDQIKGNFYEDNEDKEAIMNDRAEFLDRPRCRGVIEWINCLLFDNLLLILEAGINLWMATRLADVGLVSEYRSIIVMLMLPSVVNPAIWLLIKNKYKLSGVFIFTLLMLGCPSPFFLYLWHLYLSMFSSLRESETSKLLSNSFRMVHACICSMPLMIINVSTLINQLRVDGLEDWAIDIRELQSHTAEVNMHGLAFILSFINFVRAASLFNERETMTLLFGIVALPMTIITSLCRILLLAIVIAFVEPEWTTILLIGLVISNVLLIWATRKRTKLIQGYVVQSSSINADDLNNQAQTCSNPGSQSCLTSFCCPSNAMQTMPTTKSGKYVLTRSPSDSTINPSCWNDMGNFLLISFASIVVPSGYSNDYKMHHPRIKGGLYLILNYLVNMTIMGVSLGYTILHRVPNDFHGIHLKNPSINVNIPDVGIGIGIGGNVIKIKMPQNKVDLGQMPAMDASFNTDESDRFHAIIFPIVLATLCLPFVIMRAAMMELDCFVTRKKQLGEDFDDLLVLESHPEKSGKRIHQNNRRLNQPTGWSSLSDILAKNVNSKEIKCRLYSALLCTGMGIFVMTLFMMLMGALLYMVLLS